MNIGLFSEQQMQAAVADTSGPMATFAQAVLANLRDLVRKLQTWFQVEHNEDGTHGAVTATSLSVTPGTTSLGKLNLRTVTYVEPLAGGAIINDVTTPGIEQASCLRIRPRTNPLFINGIDATGRVQGDLLLVVNADDQFASPCDVLLFMENAGARAENRFAETPASPTSIGGFVRINGARGVWLMYDTQERGTGLTNMGSRWRVLEPSV